jgi:hypothetical protein
MATTLKAPDITSLTKFTELVEERLAASKDGVLWHRGCADFADHHLTPGLYRHPKTTGIKELLTLERDMLSRFGQRSMPFMERAGWRNLRLTSDWRLTLGGRAAQL